MSILAIGQGYTIKDYHVDIEIQKDGVANVLETILVDFNEERHGIYRDVPLNYKNKSSAEGQAIRIDDIVVLDDPFLVMHEQGQVRIRIGSPSKKVSGEKIYKIKYSVLGALEQFNEAAEFSWNIIGDRWDTHIEKASVKISFPYSIQNAKNDILLFIKDEKVQIQDIDHTLDDESFICTFPVKLKSRQGISMALRFVNHDFPLQQVPAAVLSDKYYITRSDIELAINYRSDITAKELHQVNMISKSTYVTRTFGAMGQESKKWKNIYRQPTLASSTIRGRKAHVVASTSDDEIRYQISGDFSKTKKVSLAFDYLLQGAIVLGDGEVVAALDLGSFEGAVAVDTIVVSYQLAEGMEFSQEPILDGFVAQQLGTNKYQFVRKSFLTGRLEQKISLFGFEHVRLKYPKECLYANKIVDDLDLSVTCFENGTCEIYQSMLLKNKLTDGTIDCYLSKEINSKSFPHDVVAPNLLSKVIELPIDLVSVHPDFYPSEYSDYFVARAHGQKNETRFHANYTTKALRTSDGMLFPYFFSTQTPVDHIQFELSDEDGNAILNVDESGYFMEQSEAGIELIEHDGFQYFYVPVEDDGLMSIPFSERVSAALRANWKLLASVLISGLLYFLWYVFGRDEKYDGSMLSNPPDYMTPAEAGYLWDGKLHGRDLISLIYQWAARDLILIEELEKKNGKHDYILEKLSELPETAFEYERILFEKLFTSGENRVKVSSLKNSFYSTMSKAKKSLKKEFESKHMYEPMTRGWGTIGVIFGFLITTAGLVVLGVNASSGDFSLSLPLLIVGMALILFGYYLPNKTALGSKYFVALQQFNKFIDEAPPEELAALYDRDSNYFQNTLAYAIVLGKAKKWAGRFSGLMTAPPSYYKGSHYDNFSPVLFADNVVRGMRRMESDFYSMPASSSSSTSSYSGGRSSSFGGGGFSGGGGFGGGGGSSW